jgi:hypothetical protein
MRKESHLDLNRPPARDNPIGGIKLRNAQAVKAHLLEEIIELETKLDKIKGSGDPVNLGLIQTYREMIQARRSFFAELNR